MASRTSVSNSSSSIGSNPVLTYILAGWMFISSELREGIKHFFSFSMNSGYLSAARHRGITLLGPIKMLLPFTHTWLSPPSADVSIRVALTLVFQPPTTAPVSVSSGTPFIMLETSVLVPPTSTTAHVSKSHKYEAPTRLAAGPEKMDSIGFFKASFMPITVPSHFSIISIISLAFISLLFISLIMEFMKL